jgi:NitT/TauT family transport system permease protein
MNSPIQLEDAAPGAERAPRSPGWRLVTRPWPMLTALAITLGVWQLVAWSDFRPDYVLPDPATVGRELAEQVSGTELWRAIGTTLRRAATGFALSILAGTAIGLAVVRVRLLRAAVGALITGLQTMPSIAWFPLAILLFQLSEQAILFVVVLGAAPSIANGLISGIDDLSPQLLRAARVLGARGVTLYTSVVMPAALPAYLAGLKQGWAFAWRSLMAGELLVIIAKRPSLGTDLQFARELADAPRLIAVMIVILVIGMVVDGVFSAVANGVRRRRGLGALRL